MHSAVRIYYEKLLETLVPELKKRNVEAIYCNTREEARESVMGMIPAGSSVGIGGSETVRALGIPDAVDKGPYESFRKQIAEEKDPAKQNVLRRKATTADYFIGSINAVALTGEIVNLDGGGSRIGGYAYGADKVILVTGVNKIVPTLEEAIRRSRHFVAPANGIREGKDLTCAKDGICREYECYPPHRECGKLLIIEKESRKGRITVVFVGEELGI